MSVLQPLYFAGGRYTAGTDRKLFAALYAATSTGDRRAGVIPSNQGTQSMFVSPGAGTRELTIATGLCVIPDALTQSSASPGLFLGGVDTAVETITVPANTTYSPRYDLVYAVVDETSFVITTKVLTTNVATITTSTDHGFSANQTVVISGVDDVFDGSYVIASVPTTTTFTYAKTHANVSSTAVKPTISEGSVSLVITNKALADTGIATLDVVNTTLAVGDIVTVKGLDSVLDGTYKIETRSATQITYNVNKVIVDAISSVATPNSAVARARVPFSIRVKVGTNTANPTLSLSGTESGGIPLAVVTTSLNLASTYTSGNISDVREFAGLNGAVQIYNGNAAAAPGTTNPTSGMLRYNTSTNTLEIYDSQASAFRTLYANNGSTGALSGEIFSRTTHTHTGVYAPISHSHTLSPTYPNFSATTNCLVGDSSTSVTVSSTNSASPTTLASFVYSPTSGFSGNLACLVTGTVTLTLSGTTTGQTITYVGIQTAGSSTDDDAFIAYSSVSNPVGTTYPSGGTASPQDTRVTVPFTRVINFTSATDHTIYLRGYRSNASNTAVAVQYYLTIIPIRAY